MQRRLYADLGAMWVRRQIIEHVFQTQRLRTAGIGMILHVLAGNLKWVIAIPQHRPARHRPARRRPVNMRSHAETRAITDQRPLTLPKSLHILRPPRVRFGR